MNSRFPLTPSIFSHTIKTPRVYTQKSLVSVEKFWKIRVLGTAGPAAFCKDTRKYSVKVQ